MIRYIILLIFGIFFISGQESLNSPAQEIVERGINALYNYQFEVAHSYLDSALLIDPEHAVVPFTMLAVKWLETQTEFGYDSSYAVINLEIDRIIPIYEELIKKHPNDAEYLLYLGSTYGMTGRIALAQKHWFDIITNGYRGHKLVTQALKKDPQLKDVFLPIGIMEYYSCKSPLPIQWAAKIFGIEPDCTAGLEHLKIAATESTYSWIEASNVLAYAYLYLEKDYEQALRWINPLVAKFPGHPFFVFIKAEALAKSKRWDDLELCRPALEHFTQTGHFLMRNESQLKLKFIDAVKHFEFGNYDETIELTTWIIENYHMEFDWLSGFAHILRGKCYDLRGDRQRAISDYKIMADSDNRYPEVEEAKYLLKNKFIKHKERQEHKE